MENYIIHTAMDILSMAIIFIALSMSLVLVFRTKARLRKAFIYLSLAIGLLTFTCIFHSLIDLFVINPFHVSLPIFKVLVAIFFVLALKQMSDIIKKKKGL